VGLRVFIQIHIYRYVQTSFSAALQMSTLLYELDADSIYEQLIEDSDESHDVEDDEHRDDRMEQLISRHG
jgi:arginine utilization protein RocB